MLEKFWVLIANIITFVCFLVTLIFQLAETQTYVDSIGNLFFK